MNNPDTERPEVPAETLTQLDGLLRQYRVEAPPFESPSDYRIIILYLRAELTLDEARALERRLLTSAAGRLRLRETRAAAAELPALSWREIRRRASAGDAIAATWASLTQERADLLSRGWQFLRDGAREEMWSIANAASSEARFVWSALQAFAQEWKRERQWEASLPAVAKGREATAATEWSSLLSVNVDADGTLEAILITVRSGKETDMADEEVELFAANGVGEMTLGVRRTVSGKAEWRILGLARLLNLPQGPVSSSLFRVARAADQEGTRTASQEQSLIAEIMDEQGNAIPGEGVALRMAERPRVEGDTLFFATAINGAARRAYSGYWLVLDYLLWENSPILLGAWPVAEWPDSYRPLQIEFPSAGGERPLHYLPIRLRLYPRNPAKTG